MAEDSGLDVLITTEARLAEQLATAQAEAVAMREAARLAVEAEQSGYAAELVAATAALEARSAEQCQAEIKRLQAAADTAVQRYQGLWRERGDALAALMAQHVLAAWNAEAPS